jgi:hypothetical protein
LFRRCVPLGGTALPPHRSARGAGVAMTWLPVFLRRSSATSKTSNSGYMSLHPHGVSLPTQQPGWPWLPQQVERVRTLIQLLRKKRCSLRPSGIGWRRFARVSWRLPRCCSAHMSLLLEVDAFWAGGLSDRSTSGEKYAWGEDTTNQPCQQ